MAHEPYDRRLDWAILFAVNMIVPGLLAALFVRPIGWIGVVAGASTVGGLGWLALGWSGWWCRTAVIGAALTAPTQLFPLVQIRSGANALWLVSEIPGTVQTGLGIELAFIATFATGAQLLPVSLIFGLAARGVVALIRLVRADRGTTKPRKGDPADPLAEPGY